MTALALPSPDKLTVAELRDVCTTVVQWANEQNDVETVLATREAFNVMAEYLRLNDAAREAEATMRYLEVRIGELLGPAEWGGDRKSDQVSNGKVDPLGLHPLAVHKFRQMAAHPEVVDRVIEESTESSPPSRNKVLNAIRELKRAADEENEKFKVGLAEQREWAAATFKAKPGDDWRRRERAQLAFVGLIDAVDRFVGSIDPDDMVHALTTGPGYLADNYRTDLVRIFELMEPYREAL